MHENGHGIFDGEHCRPAPPAPRGHAAAGRQEPAAASRLVVRPACGPGSLPARMHEDGSDPPTAAGASDTVPDTGPDTPALAEPRQRSKRGGSLPSFPSPLARFGSSGPGRKTRTATAKNGSGGPDIPTTVFLTPLPICASDCARPRTRPPLRPRRGPDDGAPSDRHLGGGQPNGRPRRKAIDGPARRRPGGCALGELAQAQEPIERDEQQVSTETSERDEERTERVGNRHGHERDQAARRMGDRAASTTDRGERVTPGNGRPVTTIGSRARGQRRSHLRTCPPTRTVAADAGRKLHVRRAGNDTC